MAYTLFTIFWVYWLLLAYKPLKQDIWWLENITLFAALPFVVAAYRAGLFSARSEIIIFIFAVLHISAAHYSYALTPWGNWLKRTFRTKRNHYDRIVHFLYGIVLVPVVADVFQHELPQIGFARGLFIFSVITAFGALYEIAEYIVAVMVGSKWKGLNWLGTQGDIWDTQKDMLMQAIGALIGLFLFR